MTIATICHQPAGFHLAPLMELRSTVSDQALLDYLDLAAMLPEPGTIATKALRERWACSQSQVSRRLAAVQRAGLAEITPGHGAYQVHHLKPLEVAA